MREDEFDEWMGRVPEGSPLGRLAAARWDQIPADEPAIERHARRALARLVPQPRRWPRVAVGLALAAAAGLGLALWARGPDRPAVEWTVTAPVASEAAAADDPEALAARMAATGHPREAMDAYRWLLARDPAGPSAAKWQRALIAAAVAAGVADAAWTEALALRARYGAGSTWAKYWGADAQDLVTEVFRQQATYWHREKKFDRAEEAYRQVLHDVPAGPDDDKLRYAFGELLYSAQQLPEAWEQYRVVAERHPDSPHAAFCAQSALFAAESLALASPGEGATLTTWEERMLTSVDSFADLWVDDPRAQQWEYRAGYMLYVRGLADRSQEYFDRVIADGPQTKEAQLGAMLIADQLEAKGDEDALRTRAESWLAAGWPEGELRARLEALVATEDAP